MRKFIFPTIAAALLVSACSRDEQVTTSNFTTQSYTVAQQSADIKPTADGGFIIFANAFVPFGGTPYMLKERDLVLIKTDIDGNVQWTRTFTDNTQDDEAKRVTVLPNNGGYAIVSTSRSMTAANGVVLFGKKEAVVHTLDAAGATVNTYVRSNSNYDYDASGLYVLSDGDYILTASTTNIIAKTPTSTRDTHDILIHRLSPNLAVRWTAVCGFLGNDAPLEVAESGNKLIMFGRSEILHSNGTSTYEPLVGTFSIATGSYSNLELYFGGAGAPSDYYPTAATINPATNSGLFVGYKGTPINSNVTALTLVPATFNGSAITFGASTSLSSFGTNMGYTGEMPVSIQPAGTGYIIASNAQRTGTTEAHLIRLSSTFSLEWDMLFGSPTASDEAAAAVPVLDANGAVTHVVAVGTYNVGVNPSLFWVKAND